MSEREEPPPNGGDKLSVGDIKDSKGIAIGRYARAIVNNVSVALQIPAWSVVTGALILTLGLVVVAAVLAQPDLLPRAPTPMPSPTPLAFTPAQPDQTLIIVTKFKDSSAGQKAGIDPAQRIVQVLLQDLHDQPHHIRIEPYPEAVSDSKAAKQLGSAYSATLVLWGWYDRTSITPIAEVIQAGDTPSFYGPELDISVDDRFGLCVRQVSLHSSFLSLFTLGQAYYLTPGGRSSDEALRFFNEAIQKAPQESNCVAEGMTYQPVALSWAYYYRGGVYFYRRDLDRALAEAQKALDLDPSYIQAYRGLSTIYRARGTRADLEQAIKVCTAGLERNPGIEDKAALYTNRGQVYAELGNLEAALADINEALRVDPTYTRGYASLCGVYRQKNELDAALGNCNKALELNPGYAWAYNERGRVYQAMAELDKALADYRKSAELDVSDAWPHNNQGIILGKMGRLDEALSQLNQAIGMLSEPKDLAIAYTNRCNAYRLKGETDNALADCSQALKLRPDYAEAYNTRGQAYEALNEFDNALVDYKKAAELNADDVWPHTNQGVVLAEMGKLDAALAQLDQTIAKFSAPQDQAAVYASRCEVHQQRKEPEQALADCSRAIELAPAFARGYASRCWVNQLNHALDKALADCNQSLELDPYYAWAYNERGVVYEAMGELDKALTDYQKSAELRPGDAWPHRNQGNALKKLGRWDEALDQLGQAIKLFSDLHNRADAYTDRCEIYQRKPDLDLALAECSRAIELAPAYARAYASRCKTYRLRNEPAQALVDCDQAIKLEPTYAWAYDERGVVHEALNELDKALADYQKSAELDPGDAWPRNNQGVILGKLGRLDEAFDPLSQAIALFVDPKDQALAYSNRCNAYLMKKDFERALADCNRASELDPTNVSAYDRRASIYYDRGEYDKAAEQLTRIIELAPDSGMTYWRRGTVYSRMDRLDQAMADLERARALGGDASWHGQVEQQLEELRGQNSLDRKALRLYTSLPPWEWGGIGLAALVLSAIWVSWLRWKPRRKDK